MSVDVRTRIDGPSEQFDPTAFFSERLPAALDNAADRLRAPVVALAPPPLTIEVARDVWTLLADDGRVRIEHGGVRAGAGVRVRLSPGQLADLVDDQATPMGWFSSGNLDMEGRLERLLDWWLVVRGAVDGVVPFVGGSLSFTALDGTPLDLPRAFAWDDDDGEKARYLEQTGFLHVTGVFSEDEMAAVSADMDQAAPSYSRGDGRSWWARTSDGTDRLVRMQSFDKMSATVRDLVADDRLARLGALTGDGHEWGATETNAIEALVKPIGVVEGISDVPWHKDCSLGRHSYECCSLTVGISVTGAGATTGQLRMVAGSHRVLMWPALLKRDNPLPVVDLPTQTGDVTVHLSCTLHMAQPPTERERRVLYTGFRLPPLRPDKAGEARRKLRAVREAAAVTVSQPPSPVRP